MFVRSCKFQATPVNEDLSRLTRILPAGERPDTASLRHSANIDRMQNPAVIEAVTRIEREYTAMPGLRLTALQLNRLCNMPEDVCETALHALIRVGYLKVLDGAFFRHSAKQPQRAIVA